MGISDAKKFIGQTCSVQWLDREGHPVRTVSKIHDVAYVPLYGGYLIADTEDIRLDKITAILVCAEEEGGTASGSAAEAQWPQAA
jgi:hypothetical protein